MLNTEYANVTRLGSPCSHCGSLLQLVEGSDNLVECPVCPVEPGEGATVADALEHWFEQHPPPPVAAVSTLVSFTPERQSWLLDVAGYPFVSLTEAEDFARKNGLGPIYCRPRRGQKAANES